MNVSKRFRLASLLVLLPGACTSAAALAEAQLDTGLPLLVWCMRGWWPVLLAGIVLHYFFRSAASVQR